MECTRCGRPSHNIESCYASYHVDGRKLPDNDDEDPPASNKKQRGASTKYASPNPSSGTEPQVPLIQSPSSSAAIPQVPSYYSPPQVQNPYQQPPSQPQFVMYPAGINITNNGSVVGGAANVSITVNYVNMPAGMMPFPNVPMPSTGFGYAPQTAPTYSATGSSATSSTAAESTVASAASTSIATTTQKGIVCSRCGRGHDVKKCYAKTHVNGTVL